MRVIRQDEKVQSKRVEIQQPVVDELTPMVTAMIDAYLQAKMGQVDETTRNEAYTTLIETLSWEISNAYEVFMVLSD